ncbi:MAG: hypothetical protein K8U57_14205 [Planctomycetes bacterium]|nr:hypothetical protein [Planctomycetota bacterium]
MTSYLLLEELKARRVRIGVNAGRLTVVGTIPRELRDRFMILGTGIRAMLTGKIWWGCGSEVKYAGAISLPTAGVIPAWVTLLSVEGDERWDRIHPSAWIDFPDLFQQREADSSNAA